MKRIRSCESMHTRLCLAFSLALALALTAACAGGHRDLPAGSDSPASGSCAVPVRPDTRSVQQQELDRFYLLMAYAVVYKQWQTTNGVGARGYNIGSVLVDKNKQVVFWARNCNIITGNGTQHGEVRLIQGYLAQERCRDLGGFAVYTTLEPCFQCAGMIMHTKVARAVYGQKDPRYGGGLVRLQMRCVGIEGVTDYPRQVETIRSDDLYTQMLDRDFAQWGREDITEYLASESAKAIYAQANDDFQKATSAFPENQRLMDAARTFLRERVTDDYRTLQLSP